MSVYVAPKTVLNSLLAAARAWEGDPLASCVFRKGPQFGMKLGSAPCGCVMAVRRLAGPEVPAGSGNNFHNTWELAVLLLVPDNEAAPETAEDLRLDLVDEFGAFVAHIDQRSMFGGAKVTLMNSCELGFGQYFPNDDTIYRYAEVGIQYRTLRSGSNARSE